MKNNQIFYEKLKVTKRDNTINDLEIELDKLKEDNNLLHLLEVASQRAIELQASADKATAKLTILTGRYDT